MEKNSFDTYLKKRLSKKEISDLEQEAINEFQIIQNLKEQISSEIKSYAKKENIGFNELSRRLGLSPSQLIKVRQGKANITLSTLSHIFSVLKKQPILHFIENEK